MPYITVNGYQVPELGTQDTEVPNYADAFESLFIALLQNKNSATANTDVFIPGNGVLYYTASGVTIADGDFRYEIESGTGDLVCSIRRSGIWEEFQRSHEDGTRISFTFNGKNSQVHTSVAESDDSNILISNTNDQNRIGANVVIQNVQNLAPGESSAVMPIIASVQGSSLTADSTSTIQGIPLVVSGDAAAEKIALYVRAGWTHAMKIDGQTANSLVGGYSYDNGILNDRTTAFNTPGTDVQFFDNDNDSILVGFNNPFKIIGVDLAATASQDVQATYRYSTGNDTWANLTIGSDTSNGFSLPSGQIRIVPPIDWATSNLYSGNGITAAYYVEITRTRNGLSTSPTESRISVFEDNPTSDFLIRGDGTISLVRIADSDAANNSHYYSTDLNKAAYKDPGGIVNPLY